MNASQLAPLIAAAFGIACGGETVTDPPPDDEPIVVTAVVVSPAGASVSGVGTTHQFTAQVQDLTGLLQPEAVTWTSLNPEVATIDGDGLATAVASGQVTVAAEVNDLVGYALLTVSVPEATPVTSWSIVMSGESEELYGVWGASPNEVYAVGGSSSIQTVLRYDGTGWSTMMNVSGQRLWSIWGTSSNDIYAVGGNFPSGVILHYDGADWSASGVSNRLYGVWGAAPDDVYAVGDRGTIVHHDGVGWSSVDSGTPETLGGVWGFSSSDVYAVGSNGTILHYDGTSWRAMSGVAVDYHFNAVWGTSSSDVYAVGGGVGIGGLTIVHYDGTGWSTIMDEVTGTEEVRGLQAVWGNSSSDIYVVDGWSTMQHYDGANWSLHGGGQLWGVWYTSAGSAFAVGLAGPPREGVILQGTR